MFRARNSISRRLTLLALLASATAVVCASIAFFVVDFSNAEKAMVQRLNIQAEIIG